MKSPLSGFSDNQRRLWAGFAGGGHGATFAGIHRSAMRVSDRYETVVDTFSSDPENSLRTGAALTAVPDQVHQDHAKLAVSKASRDGSILATPNHLHLKPCHLFL